MAGFMNDSGQAPAWDVAGSDQAQIRKHGKVAGLYPEIQMLPRP
jgi:hypothetical protein